MRFSRCPVWPEAATLRSRGHSLVRDTGVLFSLAGPVTRISVSAPRYLKQTHLSYEKADLHAHITCHPLQSNRESHSTPILPGLGSRSRAAHCHGSRCTSRYVTAHLITVAAAHVRQCPSSHQCWLGPTHALRPYLGLNRHLGFRISQALIVVYSALERRRHVYLIRQTTPGPQDGCVQHCIVAAERLATVGCSPLPQMV
ncbi:hypothetical protein NDU88_002012 [Pleurodeles waltl]|uniref:Uncharacterized protein n=1 Tax=Pleurodeles waltl TaxID=8319 RepID=A0AAV7LJ38_PLEWA|nr:hypothetical protein NDU88_002012 [Pleurodeles waltl]